jgi:hypothetical protein
MGLVESLGALQVQIADAELAAKQLAAEEFAKGVASVAVVPAPVDGEPVPAPAPSEEVEQLKSQVVELQAQIVGLGDKISAFDSALGELEGFEMAKIEEIRAKLK